MKIEDKILCLQTIKECLQLVYSESDKRGFNEISELINEAIVMSDVMEDGFRLLEEGSNEKT